MKITNQYVSRSRQSASAVLFKTLAISALLISPGVGYSNCTYCDTTLCQSCDTSGDPAVPYTFLDLYNMSVSKMANGVHTACSLHYGRLAIEAKVNNEYGSVIQSSAWEKNDVLLVGDSLFDLMRTEFPLSLPRAQNFAIGGSHIVTTKWVLDDLYGYYSTANAPSQIMVHIGGNDVGEVAKGTLYACGTVSDPLSKVKSNYEELFAKLQQYKTAFSCRVAIHSVPSAKDAPNSPISADVFNKLVMQQNSYLRTRCQQLGFEFIDSHQANWDSINNIPYSDQVSDDDGVHLKTLGYQNWLPMLAKQYPVRQIGQTATQASIVGSPTGLPTGSNHSASFGNLSFKYISLTVAPKQIVSLKSFQTANNFAALYDPAKTVQSGNGIPVSEAINSIEAVASYQNSGTKPKVLIGCIATVNGNGSYKVDSAPVNNSSSSATPVSYGSSFTGNLTHGASGGVWYSMYVPQTEALRILLEQPTNQYATITVVKSGGNISKSGYGEVSLEFSPSSNHSIYVRIDGNQSSVKEQKLSFIEVKKGLSQNLVYNPGTGNTAYMPSIASDGAGSNRRYMAVWYHKTSNNVITLKAAESTSEGGSWGSLVDIYLGNVTLKPHVTLDPANPHLFTYPPTVVNKGSNGWAALAPTLSGNVVSERAAASNSSWVPNRIPGVGIIETTHQSLLPHEYNPSLAYRPSDQLLIAAWQTWGDVSSGGFGQFMDLAIGGKSTGNSWWSVDLSSVGPTYKQNTGNVAFPKTGIRLDGNSGEPSATTYIEMGPMNKLIAGVTDVHENAYEVENHQLAWYPASKNGGVDGYWISAWSMKNFRDYGSDFDIFYSVGNPYTTGWSNPLPLNSDAATDNADDYLSQVGSDTTLGVRAIWERKRVASSDVFAADFVSGVWQTPEQISPTNGNEIWTNPRLTSGLNNKWIHLMQLGNPQSSKIYCIR